MNNRSISSKLNTLVGKEFGQGAGFEEINGAERELGFHFPKSFRGFLHEFGWGGAGQVELYGLGPDVPQHLDLIKVTQIERTALQTPLPLSLIPLMNDGFGNLYCLDSMQIRENECPVVFWDHEKGPGQTPALIAENFESWLESIFEERQS